MKRTLTIAILVAAFVAAVATSAFAAPLQKPDQVKGHCDDTYFPPDEKGVYACLAKDGSGIVCGGASEEQKKTCDSWSANGPLPSRVPDGLRTAAKKKADKAAADKAKAPKPTTDKPAADKPATDKPTADKPTTNKPATDKPTTDKSAPDKAAAVHDCAEAKETCSPWAAKDKNTCRTCQQAQCKTENGKDVLAGNKTRTECYEGHGPPP